MKTVKTFIILAIALIFFSTHLYSQSEKQKALTEEQQKALLSKRLPGVITGTFGSFGSLLYAVTPEHIAIHTDDKEIGETILHSPFPDYYKPTWKEMFDAIALQTKSSWKYDSTRDYWVFAKPIATKPYTITLADKWSPTDRGIYVGYKPPTAPIGMDIYYYGVYSADNRKDEAALYEKIRNSWAIGFASNFKEDVSITDMKKVTIAGVEALYYQTPTLPTNFVWRQWALVKDGHAFIIVSTLRPDNKQLLTDVETMVKSFRVIP